VLRHTDPGTIRSWLRKRRAARTRLHEIVQNVQLEGESDLFDGGWNDRFVPSKISVD
jgi:hypothetical protein